MCKDHVSFFRIGANGSPGDAVAYLASVIFDTVVKNNTRVNINIDITVKNGFSCCMVGTRQFDENVLLEVALNTFWQNGFAATSMIDVAEATGVLRGSLYNAYGDKEQLFLLVFERYSERFLGFVRQALSDPDPGVALQALFKGAIASMREGVPSRGCLTTKTALELPIAGNAIEARVRRLIDDFTALVQDALSSSAARRRLRCAPQMAAELTVTFTRGLAVMERAYSNSRHLENMSRQFGALLLPEVRRRHSS